MASVKKILKNRKVMGGVLALVGAILILNSLGIIQLFSVGNGEGGSIQMSGGWDGTTMNAGLFYNNDQIRMTLDGMLPQCSGVTTKYGHCGWRASGVNTGYGFVSVGLICDIPVDQFDAKFPTTCPDFSDGTISGIESYLTGVNRAQGYVTTGFVWGVPRYVAPVAPIMNTTNTTTTTNPPANNTVPTNTTRTIDTVTQTPAGPIQNGYVFGFGASMVLAGMAVAFVRFRR